MKKMRWDLLGGLLVIVWLASKLIRVENQPRAMQVGMCNDAIVRRDYIGMENVEMRTHWTYHIYYALIH